MHLDWDPHRKFQSTDDLEFCGNFTHEFICEGA
jgi:hypothetical protein